MQTGVELNSRYRVVQLIAEGGMARVYRAHDRILDRTVALKVLREQYAADSAFLLRFQHEARSAAGLSHPNIVSVFDVGSEDTVNYIVMELVEGHNLKQIIERDGAIGVGRALDLAMQLLAALSFAHQRGIVHRDVKPQNILVTDDGHAKVADFGIARAGTATQLTETGLVMGSVHYCAPEQAMGKGSSEASDVYSVGVVLFEMLSGQLPFESDSALGVALKHVQEPPPSLRQLNQRLSPALDGIVQRALAKEPAARYANADEILKTLQAYRRLGEQGTTAFAAVVPASDIGSANAGASTVAGRKGIAATKPARRRTVDWLVVVFAILILAMIAGWIPLAARLYELYFRPLPAGERPSVTALLPIPNPISPGSPPASGSATLRPLPPGSPGPTPDAQQLAEVPSLLGLTYTNAERQLEPLGLRISMGTQYDDLVPVGYVISQTVPAGQRVPVGEAISVTVSIGSRLFIVPNVVDMSLDAAQSALQSAGLLRVESSQQWNDRVPAGRIVSQAPVANTVVTTGTVVSLLVSNGPRRVTVPPRPEPTPTRAAVVRGIVPDLIGLPEGEARARIEEAGFTNTYTNRQDVDQVDAANRSFFLSIPEGSVVSQDPLAGITYPQGAVVRIAVRKSRGGQ